MAYMQESDFHPKNPSTKLKRHRATAPQYGIVNIQGLRDDYPKAVPQEAPAWWSTNLENAYRCQMAGYRDEKHYLTKRRLKKVEKWPESGLIKKLVRWDGLYYYFSNHRECPDLTNDNVKKAFLRETIIFENTAYLDKKLVWAPIITEQAQKFNEACDEIMRTMRKPKRSKKSKHDAGPSRSNRVQGEKSVTFVPKEKFVLMPEEGVLSEKKKDKEKGVEKPKKFKEIRKKSVKVKNSPTKDTGGDAALVQKKSPNNGKENRTHNVQALLQCSVERKKPPDKRDIYSPALATIKGHIKHKNGSKSLSTSTFSKSDSHLGKEDKQPSRKKKLPVQPSTSMVIKSQKGGKLSPIPVSARVAAKKSSSSEKSLRKVASPVSMKGIKS